MKSLSDPSTMRSPAANLGLNSSAIMCLEFLNQVQADRENLVAILALDENFRRAGVTSRPKEGPVTVRLAREAVRLTVLDESAEL